MSRIAKLIGQGAGIASEYKQHRKQQQELREQAQSEGNSNQEQFSSRSGNTLHDPIQDRSSGSLRSENPTGPSLSKKAAEAQYYDDNDDDEYEHIEEDMADWELDEAFYDPADEPPSYEESEQGAGAENTLLREVLAKDAKSASQSHAGFARAPLPFPVILPQRRPGSKSRGFVRAYAPLLGECCGIDQETFLAFLKNFHKSSQASPVFGVVMIGAAGAGFAPGLIAMAVSTGVQIGAQIGMEMDSRHKTNTFLDKINKELFIPHGVYAMIMKYKPDAAMAAQSNSRFARFGIGSDKVDLGTNSVIAKSIGAGGDMRTMSDRMRKFKLGDDTTSGSAAMPEAAPLIFPQVDHAIATDRPETFKDKTRDAKKFLAGYIDRRKQMQYALNNPNDALAVPEDQRGFTSKYADPNHPMYSGGLLGVVSGGAIQTGGRGRDRRSRSDDDRRPRQRDDGRRPRRERKGGLITGLITAATQDPNQRRGPSYDDDVYGYDRSREYYDDDNYQERPARVGRSSYDAYGYPQHPQDRGGRPDDLWTRPGPSSYDAYGNAGPSRYAGAAYGDPPVRPGPSSYNAQAQSGRRRGDRQKGGARGVKRMLQEDVLYLTIVNMPSEAELAEARRALGISYRG